MVEAMAAANAFLRLKTEDKSLSVSIIYAQWLLCDYPCKMHTWHPKEQRLHCKRNFMGEFKQIMY